MTASCPSGTHRGHGRRGKGLSMKAHGDCKSLHEGVLTEKDRPGWAPAAHEANFVFPLDVVILITARREKAYSDVREPNPNVPVEVH